MPVDDSPVEKLIKAIGTVPKAESSDFIRGLEAKSQAVEAMVSKENDGILAMREKWSNWVLIFIGLIVVFDIILVYFYGAGVWDFKDSKVVIVVITENFLKIVGLGMLITHNIFKKIYR